jgi:hypothetical protein
VKAIDQSPGKWFLGTNENKVDRVTRGPLDESVNLVRGDRHVFGDRRGTGVSGGAKELTRPGTLTELPEYGVLARAISDDKDIHRGHALLARKRDSGRGPHQLNLDRASALGCQQIVLELAEPKNVLVEGTQAAYQPVFHRRRPSAGTVRSGCLANDLPKKLIAIGQAQHDRRHSGFSRRFRGYFIPSRFWLFARQDFDV